MQRRSTSTSTSVLKTAMVYTTAEVERAKSLGSVVPKSTQQLGAEKRRAREASMAHLIDREQPDATSQFDTEVSAISAKRILVDNSVSVSRRSLQEAYADAAAAERAIDNTASAKVAASYSKCHYTSLMYCN